MQAIAAEQSSLLNKAYQTLLSPLSRAEYILAKNGHPALETDKLTDEEFIIDVLEIREELESARTTEEVERIQHENDGIEFILWIYVLVKVEKQVEY